MGLDISNTSTMTIRVKHVKIRDEKGNVLEFIDRGHTAAITSFEIRGGFSLHWTVFCRGKIPNKIKEQVKLKLEFERVGHRSIKLDVVSTLVTAEKLPTGEWFFLR